MAFCSRCGTGTPTGSNYCANCGQATFSAGAPQGATHAPPAYPTSAAYSPPPAHDAAPPPNQGIAIAGLLLNIFIWPGLGTLVTGDNRGWAQGFLMLGGLILTITIIGLVIGIPMMIGAWIWALVSSVQNLGRAS